MGDLLTFVIVNYDTAALLEECLGSIRQYNTFPAKVVVVDNASTDGSVEMVRQQFSEVHLIVNSANEGYPKAVNRGLMATDTPFSFILNSDVRLTENTLPLLIDHIQTHPRVGIAAPAQRTPDGKALLTVHRDPTLWREILRNLFFTDFWRYRVRGADLAREMREPKVVDWVMGAALFVRQEMVDQVGAMDETVFMYGEEFDWAYRARKAGWEVSLVPASVVIHHKGATADRVLQARRYSLVTKSNYYFFAKHFGLAYLPFLVLAHVVGSALRVLLVSPLCLAGFQEARFQWWEHLYTVCVSLDPRVYRWIRRALAEVSHREER
ncbi:MAG: glycosyltransferase family 2 protein [Anaerolineae bacterium]|nr:MAG: glycosyltransferase family 2 protein [Anaerolineae bacterium]